VLSATGFDVSSASSAGCSVVGFGVFTEGSVGLGIFGVFPEDTVDLGVFGVFVEASVDLSVFSEDSDASAAGLVEFLESSGGFFELDGGRFKGGVEGFVGGLLAFCCCNAAIRSATDFFGAEDSFASSESLSSGTDRGVPAEGGGELLLGPDEVESRRGDARALEGPVKDRVEAEDD
jgi:hypothetical protein